MACMHVNINTISDKFGIKRSRRIESSDPMFYWKSEILKDPSTHNSSLLLSSNRPDTKHKGNVNFVRSFFATENWLSSLRSLNALQNKKECIESEHKKELLLRIHLLPDHQIIINRVLYWFCHLTHKKKTFSSWKNMNYNYITPKIKNVLYKKLSS